MNEWIFSDNQRVCHFRVAGLLIRDNKLFVQSDKDGVCAIPGGHVAFGETSTDALTREFKEEAGVDINIDRLVWVEENFWQWGAKDAHNISFYYLVSLKNNADIPDDFAKKINDNSDIMLSWITFDEVKTRTIYPQFIKDKIENIAGGVEHFVRRG